MGDKPIFGFDPAAYTERVDSDEFGTETRNLYEMMTSRVIGQDRAARRLARGQAVYNAGLQDDKGCMGAFLFAGPTGVGKTLMAEAFARSLVGESKKAPLTRIQCSRFTESHRVSELLGSPPGYVGNELVPALSQRKIDEAHFWSKLQDYVRNQPEEKRKKTLTTKQFHSLYEQLKPHKSVVLFDEIEKAHPNLWKLLLHIIDDGELAMSNGNVTDFRNTVIILTSNIGSWRIQELLSKKDKTIGFRGEAKSVNEDADQIDAKVYDETLKWIEQTFQPELVGRLRNEIIVFRALGREHCAVILDGFLQDIRKKFDASDRSKSIPLSVEFTDAVKEFLLNEGIDQKYGLRPLKQTVRKYIVAKLANAIEAGELQPGDQALFVMAPKKGGKASPATKDGMEPTIFRKPRPPSQPRQRLYLPPPKSKPPSVVVSVKTEDGKNLLPTDDEDEPKSSS
jgi:ATP-dependent Clp protease ATP-binding subunit ClpC